MTERRLQRNQNQAQWEALFIVYGAHYAKYNAISTKKNDNKPVQKKRFADSCHEKDSPWWFWRAVVFFTMNMWTTTKRSLPRTYTYTRDTEMLLVVVCGALRSIRIPSTKVALLCEKRLLSSGTDFNYTTLFKRLAAALYTLSYYSTHSCMVGCWMGGSWVGRNCTAVTAMFEFAV